MTETKIALVGAAGRMGLEITRAAHATGQAVIGAAVEYDGCPLTGKDIGGLAGIGNTGVLITSDMATAFESCDVVLDVSLPQATMGVIEGAVASGTPLVCGITGALEEGVNEKFTEAAEGIALIHTKNFSVGIAVLASLAARAAQILGTDYDIEIIEAHHRKKVDAPSGTAEILADAVVAATPDTGRSTVFGREGKTGERPTGQIGIHALRGGGIFGEHKVMFAGENERIEISHKAETRALFAQGAVRTALFIAQAPPGRYTMKDVLDL